MGLFLNWQFYPIGLHVCLCAWTTLLEFDRGFWESIVSDSIVISFLSFSAAPMACEVPGPGIETEPRLHFIQQLWQCWILYLTAPGQTRTSAANQAAAFRFLTHCTTAGTTSIAILKIISVPIYEHVLFFIYLDLFKMSFIIVYNFQFGL